MTLKGVLNLKHSNDEYLIFSGGRITNISEYLNVMLLNDVYVEVTNSYDGKVLFSESGQLVKEKVSPKYYMYHVNGTDLDSVLWNNVGNRLEIEIKNITKN